MGKTPLYFAVKVSFKVAREEIFKNLYIFNALSFTRLCNKSLKWSLLGVKKKVPGPLTEMYKPSHKWHFTEKKCFNSN